MNTYTPLRILRKPQAMQALGLPLSTFNLRVRQRLITKPISLGARAVGWPSSEIEALVNEICRGASRERVGELVIELERRRKASKTSLSGLR